MNKSMLVIETPESCEKCQLCVNVLGKHYCAAKGTHIAKGERDCSCPLVAVPTVEAVPVVHGEWIAQDEGLTKFMCSVCNGKNHGGHEKFCPDCGADMRKKVNE